VSSLHLQFIQPMASGVGELLAKFPRVLAVENAWADRLQDEIINPDNRRYSPLAMMLRSRFLVDVDCWTEARGAPIKPGTLAGVIRERLGVA
jgi:2-oxoglutarate ferredoxin oxidoreductase subunit alpha